MVWKLWSFYAIIFKISAMDHSHLSLDAPVPYRTHHLRQIFKFKFNSRLFQSKIQGTETLLGVFAPIIWRYHTYTWWPHNWQNSVSKNKNI